MPLTHTHTTTDSRETLFLKLKTHGLGCTARARIIGGDMDLKPATESYRRAACPLAYDGDFYLDPAQEK